MNRTYELKDFRKDAEGVCIIFYKEGKYSFVLEARINKSYVTIEGYGYDTEEKALLSAFNSLEGRFNGNRQRCKGDIQIPQV